jgi:hypothetical protein
MKRTEMLQEIRKMRFEEVYFGWSESRYRGWNVKHFYSWYRRDGGQRSYSWVKNTL